MDNADTYAEASITVDMHLPINITTNYEVGRYKHLYDSS